VTSLAIIESPLQLVSLIEAIECGVCPRDSVVGLRCDSSTTATLIELSRRSGFSQLRVLSNPSRRDLVRVARGVSRLVVGDLFSGLAQSLVLFSEFDEILVVDDGAATIEAFEAVRGGSSLVRPRDAHRSGRAALSSAALVAVRRASNRGGLRWFSNVIPAEGRRDVTMNGFRWSRRAALDVELAPRQQVILGTALASDGLLSTDWYHQWLRRSAAGPGAYFFPHRREMGDTVRMMTESGAVVVENQGLPAELCLRDMPTWTRFSTLPSTIALTLPALRESTDLRCELVPAHAWTPAATPRLRALSIQIVQRSRAHRSRLTAA
jgi:hypothetical protein